MRKQVRGTAPSKLAENADKWNNQWAQLRERNPAATFQWYKIDGRSAREWILPDLKKMTQGHCAFCDTFPLEDRSAEPVEHFRPKTNPRFEMLAYAWENLYYCCDLCQKTKREQWNDDLIAPDGPHYSFARFFIFDFTTGELKPNPKANVDDQRCAAITIALYGLDLPNRQKMRKLELRKWARSNNREIDDYGYRDFVELGPVV